MIHPSPAPYVVRRITSGEWRELRALRLEALKDSPTAFSVTYAATEAFPDQVWQAMAAEAATSDSTALFVAVAVAVDETRPTDPTDSTDSTDPAGAWLGMAGAAPMVDIPDHAHVYSVYVTPAHRGRRGPADALMRAAIGFAEAHIDVAHLTLGVHESNVRAQTFYARLGFEPTGLRVPYPLDPAEQLVILGYPAFRPAAH
ncbi:GNAT family N-acetyltransferase [Streptacidiphilus jiangxiensis]|uniref:Ribosomal protein S18 acetylase RimI n=1 Tax=Streptacidiphilus jiangxiensis TaxID=235985 RepID=A0A1H7VVS7_STRJI|nr:N-acetyltransferase [Streptacidiphilus jiangxiensis]SEM13432.1 Ribosomal protein S18 acetylase RimI [Streptacidiphilus jiangxiensis]